MVGVAVGGMVVVVGIEGVARGNENVVDDVVECEVDTEELLLMFSFFTQH